MEDGIKRKLSDNGDFVKLVYTMALRRLVLVIKLHPFFIIIAN